MKNTNRDLRLGIIGLILVAVSMLSYALFGHPPYVFFTFLRWTVAAARAIAAWALLSQRKIYLPVSESLVIIGGIHWFDRMRRTDWRIFNWCGIVFLFVAASLIIVELCQHKIMTMEDSS